MVAPSLPKIGVGHILLPIIIGVLVFIVALAWNEAITGAIDYFVLHRRPNLLGRDIAALFIYAIIASLILIGLVWMASRAIPKSIRA